MTPSHSEGHGDTSTIVGAAALAINATVDVDCGVAYAKGLPGAVGRSKPPLATENLLENTDGELRPPPSAFCRANSLLPSVYADARYIDDVIAF